MQNAAKNRRNLGSEKRVNTLEIYEIPRIFTGKSPGIQSKCQKLHNPAVIWVLRTELIPLNPKNPNEDQ